MTERLALPLNSYMILGKIFSLSKLQFPHQTKDKPLAKEDNVSKVFNTVPVI